MSVAGAVACGHPVTAQAAIEILEQGGNAFDAAIAAQFTACVVEPVLCSLGGGGFLLARPSEAKPRLYDFFAHTPRQRSANAGSLAAIDADFGTATQTFHIGAGSIATPGTVAGMFSIHRALGSLPMARLLEPAIRCARDGVAINDFQGYIFDIVRPIYAHVPPFNQAHTGVLLRQPQLADSLEALGREGAELFYQGEIGRRLVAHCRDAGGHLSQADLDHYQVIERTPLCFEYAGATIYTNPRPSVGGILIQHSLQALDETDTTPPAIARAFAATQQWRATLSASADQVSRGTTHISVIDKSGNVAAMTLSNGEGSGSLIPDTGIMPNNMLGEEDINPAGIDHWQPDQRLGSMMAPTILVNDQQICALGSGGSNRIRSALVQVLVHLLNHENAPADAVSAPRLHLEDRLLSVEAGFPATVMSELHRLVAEPAIQGQLQQWPEQNLFFGGVHLVQQHRGQFIAAGDPRRGGAGQSVMGSAVMGSE